MKVFKNVMGGSYAGGLLLVAANSPEEAHDVCMKDDSLESRYWNDYGNGRINDGYSYSPQTFEEIPNLSWQGEPCVIAEDSYYE